MSTVMAQTRSSNSSGAGLAAAYWEAPAEPPQEAWPPAAAQPEVGPAAVLPVAYLAPARGLTEQATR